MMGYNAFKRAFKDIHKKIFKKKKNRNADKLNYITKVLMSVSKKDIEIKPLFLRRNQRVKRGCNSLTQVHHKKVCEQHQLFGISGEIAHLSLSWLEWPKFSSTWKSRESPHHQCDLLSTNRFLLRDSFRKSIYILCT